MHARVHAHCALLHHLMRATQPRALIAGAAPQLPLPVTPSRLELTRRQPFGIDAEPGGARSGRVTEISSPASPVAKHLARLRANKSYRRRQGAFVVHGASVVHDLLVAGALPYRVVAMPEALRQHRAPRGFKGSSAHGDSASQVRHQLAVGKAAIPRSTAVYSASTAVMRKVTGLDSIDEARAVVAEVPLPEPALDIGGDAKTRQRVLVVDGVSDPGNLGSLLRTAYCLGWDGALLLPGTVDPFNDKAVTASRGAVATLPLLAGDPAWERALELASSPAPTPGAFAVCVADSNGDATVDAEFSARASETGAIMLVVANEAHGPSIRADALLAACAAKLARGGSAAPPVGNGRVTIPMGAGSSVQSLNVAAAGAILMHAML